MGQKAGFVSRLKEPTNVEARKYAWNRKASVDSQQEQYLVITSMIQPKFACEDGSFIPSNTRKKIGKVGAFILCYMSKTVQAMVMEYLNDSHTNLPGLHIFKLAMLRKKCLL
jgi:hypothetical protein